MVSGGRSPEAYGFGVGTSGLCRGFDGLQRAIDKLVQSAVRDLLQARHCAEQMHTEVKKSLALSWQESPPGSE